MSSKEGIRHILRDLWSSRELIDQLVRRDVRLRYRQAVMGFAWALLMPALTIGASLVIQGAIAKSGTAPPSLAGIALKSWAWAFFAGSMNFATISLLANISLVTKIWFPREVLPVGAVLAQAFDSFVGLVILAIFIALAPFIHLVLGWSVLWFPVLVLILFTLTTGLAFLFACANIFFRDVKYILQVVLTFGIFFTPVLLEPAQMPGSSLIMLNPLSPILEGIRLSATAGHDLSTPLIVGDLVLWQPWWLIYSAIWSVVVLWIGLRLFRNSAGRFAEAY